MVKLVVADDEERVCRLILALGEWEKLGIEVAGTAANGIQALEMIRRGKNRHFDHRYPYAWLQRYGTDRKGKKVFSGH